MSDESFPYKGTKWQAARPFPEGENGVAVVVGFKTIVVYEVTYGDKTYELSREMENFTTTYPTRVEP